MLFLAAALLYPSALNPLNRMWLKFGLLLHKVVNPIVMGLVFYGTVLPTGLVARAMRRICCGSLCNRTRIVTGLSAGHRGQPPKP